MKKLFIILTVILFGCGGTEEKQISKSDSLSIAMDSAQANDSLLLKLKSETSIK